MSFYFRCHHKFYVRVHTSGLRLSSVYRQTRYNAKLLLNKRRRINMVWLCCKKIHSLRLDFHSSKLGKSWRNEWNYLIIKAGQNTVILHDTGVQHKIVNNHILQLRNDTICFPIFFSDDHVFLLQFLFVQMTNHIRKYNLKICSS